MLVGHYAPAYLIKSLEPKIPLWALFIATQLVDIVWAIFILTGIEKVRIIDGFTATTPLDLYFMPYTHGLLSVIIWGSVSLIWYRFVPNVRPWRSALFFGFAVLSHWFLDLIVHSRDLPLYGDSYKMGFGLWNFPAASLSVELGILAISIIYMCKHLKENLVRHLVLAVILFGCQLYSHFGPLPTSPKTMASTTLTLYVILALFAYAVEKKKLAA